MGNGDETKCVFPLTSLQIGDLQSYLSDLSIFLGNKSKKIYILVDNRPWLNPGTRSAHFWQLMVTKSRLSPFANTKGRGEKKKQKQEEEEKPKEACSQPNNKNTKKFKKWFSLIDATTFSTKKIPAKKLQSSLYLNKELHKTLYGFIVFEIEWANVRGINYLNELQTDTSLAIEAKLMRRWEFESIDQAVKSMSQWFSGSKAEKSCLREYLDSTIGEVFHDAEAEFSKTSPVDDDEYDSPCCSRSVFNVNHSTADYDENEPHTPPLTGPYKRRRVTKAISTGVEVDYMEETPKRKDNSVDHWESHVPDGENIIEATQYKDVLVLVRCGDRDLPFKLREVIMADIRLLTLLEAGLPSWVLFLQSYPGFCHLYRPWMCLLARALYVMISVITVLIGFYDLYKNVPVLKATASRLCGPLFDWVETWDMVSRIKYLGTMLFLHNFQKAVRWGLTMARAMQSFGSLLIMPLVNPLLDTLGLLLPLWNSLAETVASLVSVVWIVIESGCNLVGDVVELVLLPIWFIISLVWNITNTVLVPLFCLIWELIYAPIRVVVALANCLAFSFSYIFDVIGDLWRYMSSILQLASDSQAAVKTYEVSMWRTLWNDLFSHVFRAVRSILNGFVAFFAACNRHQLSTYNHIQEFIERLHGRTTTRSESIDSRHGKSAKNNQRTASGSSSPSLKINDPTETEEEDGSSGDNADEDDWLTKRKKASQAITVADSLTRARTKAWSRATKPLQKEAKPEAYTKPEFCYQGKRFSCWDFSGEVSQIMKSWGFKDGIGLGRQNQGRLDIIQTIPLPYDVIRQGLGYSCEYIQRQREDLRKQDAKERENRCNATPENPEKEGMKRAYMNSKGFLPRDQNL